MINRSGIVLVVEDNPEDTRLLQMAARKAGPAISFHFVPDGEQAIAYLKGEGAFSDRQAHPLPELVLLDLWLPQIDGFEVLSWIRSRAEFKGLKVFVWTDSAFQEIIERGRLAGADRFVPKSVAFVQGGLAGFIHSISKAVRDSAEARARQSTEAGSFRRRGEPSRWERRRPLRRAQR
jgi:CheY-like chemotaxis protein